MKVKVVTTSLSSTLSHLNDDLYSSSFKNEHKVPENHYPSHIKVTPINYYKRDSDDLGPNRTYTIVSWRITITYSELDITKLKEKY